MAGIFHQGGRPWKPSRLCRARAWLYGGLMETPIIRKARPDDAEALARLARETFCETFVEGFAISYPPADLKRYLEAAYAPKAVAGWIEDERGLVLVAAEAGRLLAYVQAGENALPAPGASPLDGELKRLYVARAAQGQGLGARLLDAGLAWLRGRRTFIGVWSGNARAIALYRSRGFSEVGAYRFQVGASVDEEVILGRDAEVCIGAAGGLPSKRP
jgi:ribosomal protein S18 acetylase RimI-like enzyme